MKLFLNSFILFLSVNCQAVELELVPNYSFTKFTYGKILTVKSALAKASRLSGSQAATRGISAGSSLAYIAGGGSSMIKTSAFVGGLVALIKNNDKVDVVVLSVELNDGSKAIVNQPKYFSFKPGDNIILSETNEQAFIYLNRELYSEQELSIIDNRETYFQKESAMALGYKKQCENIKEKKLRNRLKQRYVEGKAKCDLVPVVLTKDGIKPSRDK